MANSTQPLTLNEVFCLARHPSELNVIKAGLKVDQHEIADGTDLFLEGVLDGTDITAVPKGLPATRDQHVDDHLIYKDDGEESRPTPTLNRSEAGLA